MSRFIIQAAPLPPDFSGTLQELFEAMLDRMEVVTDGQTFIEASSLPTTNVGPVLLDGTQWWVWDEDSSAYAPLDISASETLEISIGETEPEDGEPRLWAKTSGTTFLGLYVYMGSIAGFVPMTLPDGSITNDMLAGGITADKFAEGVLASLSTITGTLSVSKLTVGSAYQILRTNQSASAAEWQDMIKESDELTIPGAGAGGDNNVTISAEHGLGATPRLVRAVLVCKSSEGGYAVNDETDAMAAVESNDADTRSGLYANSEDVVFIKRKTFQLPLADGSNRFLLTPANWKLKFYFAR